MGKGKIIHGARAKVVFEGVIIGVLTNITENEDYGMQGVYGIGHWTPQELVALRFTGNFNFTMLVMSSDLIASLQYAERTGKTVLEIAKAILIHEGFTLVIEDKYNNNANIATISMCKMNNISLTVSENAIATRSGSGMYGEPIVMP